MTLTRSAALPQLLAEFVLRVICLLFAAFCSFGFLASFEPGVSAGWKFGYAAVSVLALTCALFPRRFLRLSKQ
jgi:hypothetical protein